MDGLLPSKNMDGLLPSENKIKANNFVKISALGGIYFWAILKRHGVFFSCLFVMKGHSTISHIMPFVKSDANQRRVEGTNCQKKDMSDCPCLIQL